MAILIHVVIAMSSIIYSSVVLLMPDQKKLKISYGLVAATVASGTYLIISLPSHLVSACFSGLTYLAIVMILTVASHYRLASKKNKS
jgi:hypothetical protein